MASLIGGGSYQVFLTNRGGGSPLLHLEDTTISINPVLNDSISCHITTPSSGPSASACCEALNECEPWKHELIVYRDDETAFVGPVINVEGASDSGTIEARDLFYWTERRFIDKDLFFWGDLADTFRGLWEAAMAIDNPNVELITHATGTKGERSYKGKDFHRAADLLKELSRTALDFTTLGRTIYAGGIELITGLPMDPILIVDQSVVSATVTKDGSQLATDVAVFAGSVDAFGKTRSEPLVARAQSEESEFGVVQQTFSELLILDLESAYENANAHLHAMLPSPRRVSVTLSPSSAFEFEDLIPGRRVDVRLINQGCIPVNDIMRINSINITGGQTETVSMDLVPIGVTDSA